jgi:hypothetical protein
MRLGRCFIFIGGASLRDGEGGVGSDLSLGLAFTRLDLVGPGGECCMITSVSVFLSLAPESLRSENVRFL